MSQIHMARTFVDALAKLDGADARRTARFLDKLMSDQSRTSFRFEKVNDARDPKIRSARVTKDLRVILHQDSGVLLLLYVDHHDIAYGWARTKCVECHMVTGAMQVVEAPEIGEQHLAEADVPDGTDDAEQLEPATRGFDHVTDEYLLSIGVPPDWLPVIRQIREETQFWAVAEDLPDAVAERLLRVMLGELAAPPTPVIADTAVLTAPDTRHWICTVSDDGGLCQLIEDRPPAPPQMP